jgi:hypothetical protein
MGAMEQARDLWRPLIGQLVWGVRRGVETSLTMEFGSPHLSIREPIVANPQHTARVRRNLARRRVYVVGDWHFWIQYGEWKLSTADGVLESRNSAHTPFEECLVDLEGQHLLSVESGSDPNSCVFNFDRDGVLEIRPSAKVPDTQWSLHSWEGDIASYGDDGQITFEKNHGM